MVPFFLSNPALKAKRPDWLLIALTIITAASATAAAAAAAAMTSNWANVAIVDDHDTSIKYSGGWVPSSGAHEWAAFELSTTSANDPNSVATFTFTGTVAHIPSLINDAHPS